MHARTRALAFAGAMAVGLTLTDVDGLAAAAAPTSSVVAQADVQDAYPGFAQTVWVTSNDSCDPDPIHPAACSNSASFAGLDVVTPPEFGSAVVDGRQIIYTGNSDATGDDHFSYRVTDVYGVWSEADVTITLTPVPDPPVASDDDVETYANLGVRVPWANNDQFPALIVARVDVEAQPSHGTAVAGGGTCCNTLTYQPEPGFVGVDSFSYRATDMWGQSDTAVVAVSVVNPPAPTAGSREYTMLSGARRRLLSMFNGSQIPPGTTHTYGTPQHGTLVVKPRDVPVYEPAPGFVGDDTIDYTLTNSVGDSSVGQVVIHVRPQPTLTLSMPRQYAYYPSYMAFGSVTATAPNGSPMANVHVHCHVSDTPDDLGNVPTDRHGQAAVVVHAQAHPSYLLCRAPGVHAGPVLVGMQPHFHVDWPAQLTAGVPFELSIDIDHPAPNPQITLQRETASGWVDVADAASNPTVTLNRERPGSVVYRVFAAGADFGWVESSTRPHTITWVSP